MSAAYKCDYCLECFEGSPHAKTKGDYDICWRCAKAMERMFPNVDRYIDMDIPLIIDRFEADVKFKPPRDEREAPVDCSLKNAVLKAVNYRR